MVVSINAILTINKYGKLAVCDACMDCIPELGLCRLMEKSEQLFEIGTNCN